MKQEDLDFFKENGYLIIQVLSPDEVGRYLEIFERERRDNAPLRRTPSFAVLFFWF